MPREVAPKAESSTLSGARLGLFAGAGLCLLMLVLPAPAGMTPIAWRVAAVAVLMAIWWMTEALPIPATALLPTLLLPVLGITDMRTSAAPYAHPLVFLLLGGFILALGLERWHLPRRLALTLISTLGTRPPRIVAGLCIATALLSMWISNTATTMLMLPIGLSIADLVDARQRSGPSDSRVSSHFTLCALLGIAYSASVGGLGSLIGTPSNALLAAYMLETFGVEVGFLDWLLMGLPLVTVGIGVIWWVLVRWVYPLQVDELPGGPQWVRQQLHSLGPMSPAEKRVATVFTVTALLWVLRPQLQQWLPLLSDGGIAIFGAILLFLLPSGMLTIPENTAIPKNSAVPKKIDGSPDLRASAPKLLDWSATRRLPWGILLLFGGGLSLASAIQNQPTPETSLAIWIGQSLESISAWPPLLLTLIVVLLIIFLTELTSNTATAAAFIPILGSVAAGVDIAPLTLLVPVTMAASCAFMLPVATPPNAIVYGSERITIRQMARAGLVLNLLFWILVTVAGLVLPRFLDATG